MLPQTVQPNPAKPGMPHRQPHKHGGFTLIELIAVVILVGIVSVSFISRVDSPSTNTLQAARDMTLAAVHLAQESAMARSGISLVITSSSVSVTENGTPLAILSNAYPLSFPGGVTATATSFTFDKLGRTTAGTISLTGGGRTAVITLEATGYAYY
jgi:MSHA pilin protein MshC